MMSITCPKTSIFLMQRSKITVVYRSPYRTRRLRPIFRRGTDEVSGRGRRPSSLRSDASLDMARVSGSLVNAAAPISSVCIDSGRSRGPPMLTQKQHLDFFHSTAGRLIFFAADIIILLLFAFTLA